MKVYIVTSGCYSEWHIDAVCDDEEKARKICSLIDADDGPAVNVWDTDIYDIIDDGTDLYDVTVTLADNKIIHIHAWKLNNAVFNKIITDCGAYWDRSDADIPNIVFRVRAKDEEHARKIALDRYYMWKAEKEGAV